MPNETIELGACPTCGGPAQFVADGIRATDSPRASRPAAGSAVEFEIHDQLNRYAAHNVALQTVLAEIIEWLDDYTDGAPDAPAWQKDAGRLAAKGRAALSPSSDAPTGAPRG